MKNNGKRLITLTLVFLMALSILQVNLLTINAVGNFPVGVIADCAETRAEGQWAGQCKRFVNDVVREASSGTISLYGYQEVFASFGLEVSSDNAIRGDIIQITPAGSNDSTAESLFNINNSAKQLHTAIILTNNGGGNFQVIDSNSYGYPEKVHRHAYNPYTSAAGSIIKIWRLGTYTPTPPPTKPTYATISISKTVCSVNENVTFNFASDNGANFTIGIDKGNTRIDTTVCGASYTRSFSEAGSYSAYVTAWNSTGSKDSARVYFTVGNKPGVPILSVANTSNKATEGVKFTWSQTSNANFYNLRIKRGTEDFSVWNISELSASIKLQSGHYTAYLDACNSSGLYTKGNDVEFDVAAADYIPKSTVEYNGHIYSIYDESLSWKDAKTTCEKMGGHLASVTDKAEQKVIEGLLKNGTKTLYFLGATDEVNEGTFKWVTGESFSYTNWVKSQPDNYQGNENFLMIYNQTNLYNGESLFGKWNDIDNNFVNCSLSPGFICEVEPTPTPDASTTYNGKNYLLFDNNMTWKDAQAYCASIGGNLATITSSQEQTIVSDLITKGKKSYYYIGAKDEASEGIFKWVTGEPFSYTYWNTNQPDNASGLEDYLMIYNISNISGKWNDVPNCNASFSYGFICEMVQAPTITSYASVSYNSTKITWSSVAGVSGYQVWRSTSQNGTYTLITSTTSTSYTNTGLATGTTYYYKLRAYKSYTSSTIYSKYTSPVSAKPALAVPSGLKAAVQSYNSVNVTWTAASNATGYQVYRCTSQNGTYTLIKTTTATSLSDTGLTNGTTYYYKVRAYRYIGPNSTVFSDYAAVVSARPVQPMPANLKATPASYTSINVTWNAASNATGYQVYRCTSQDGTYSLIKTTSTTSYADAGLVNGTAYYYKVRSYRYIGPNNNAFSDYTAVISAKPVELAIPASLKAATLSKTSIKLTWNSVSGATGYQVYRSTSQNGTYTLVNTTTAKEFTNTGLTSGTTYYYKVRAYVYLNSNNNVFSKDSVIISIKPN